MNRYNWYVLNKDIEGEQYKIMWHIDNIKTSHRYPKVVTNIIDIIISVYGRDYPLTVTRGKVH